MSADTQHVAELPDAPLTIVSLNDFHRAIKLKQMLTLDKTTSPWVLKWQTLPNGWCTTGKLDAWQESCPNVSFEFTVFDEHGGVQLQYTSFSRYDHEATVLLSPSLSGQADWYQLDYFRDKLQAVTRLSTVPTLVLAEQSGFAVNDEGASLMESIEMEAAYSKLVQNS